MKPAQFDTLAHFARFKPASKAREAARLYIIESQPQHVIAARLGISPPAVSRACKRFIETWRKFKQI